MAHDELDRLEAALEAISRITSDDPELIGARCPKCNAEDFIKISDLYSEAIVRLEENAEPPGTLREGGMTDPQIVSKFTPPQRKTAVGMLIVVAVPLSLLAYYLYRRFGQLVGQLGGMATLVVTAVVFLTTLRRNSDRYYHGRQRWNKLHMCRRCGQLVAP